MEYRFCPLCCGKISYQVPRGDQRQRAVCQDCHFVHYQNPNVVVGAVVLWQSQYLLCRRAIEPRRGYWTFPAGYLECEESTEAGAMREAWEEAQVKLKIEGLLAVYNLAHLSQVQVLYLASMQSPGFGAGEESLEVQLFDWEQIPWHDLAFPSAHFALRHAHEMQQNPELGPDLRSADLKLDHNLW